ncbi:MAG: hypothetical protein M1321_01975 [Candidatus Marsarchaeota archaeon]|nr:hypothetical protein [Candidatus Marsarchaeota archaeon]
MSAEQGQHRGGQHNATKSEDKIMFIVAYLVPVLAGVVVYVLYADKDRELRFHAVQSILFGVAFWVLWWILGAIFFISFAGHFIWGEVLDAVMALLWLYGLYVGYNAFMGRRILIPVAGNLAKES